MSGANEFQGYGEPDRSVLSIARFGLGLLIWPRFAEHFNDTSDPEALYVPEGCRANVIEGDKFRVVLGPARLHAFDGRVVKVYDRDLNKIADSRVHKMATEYARVTGMSIVDDRVLG